MDNTTINIIFRTILILIILFILVRIMGKKQISQLNLYDYIIGITIGNIAADISLDVEKNLIGSIICICIYGLSSALISYLTQRNIKLRRFFSGIPTILIENGKIIESKLKKAKININDLLEESRQQGYFNIEEIESAIMEVSGRISFLPKIENKPIVNKNMKLKLKKEEIPANIIIDRYFLENNLKNMYKDKKWFDKELEKKGYLSYDNILLATLDNHNKIVVYEKNVTINKPSILE